MLSQLQNYLKNITGDEWSLQATADEKFGDYSSNLAFRLGKARKMAPMAVAESLAKELAKKDGGKFFARVVAAAPGFINFMLQPAMFHEELRTVLKLKNKYGRNNTLKTEKTIVEYTDPNPFKEFHIGHLMSNTIGEALSRIVEWNGAEVKRACYQGDVGMHVAKAVWGWAQTEKNGFFPDVPFEKWTLEARVNFWGGCYKKGSAAFDLGREEAKEIAEINRKIYEGSDKTIVDIYAKGKQTSLDYFEQIYKKLGTKFDYKFFESETGVYGKEIVEDGIKKGIFEKSEGAIVFKGEKYGLHTRVFINSEGLPTYEAKELGLAGIKYKKYAYDKSIVITGNEVDEYFKVLLKAMELIFPELAKKTLHLSHGMLRLPTGKMSSRTGDVITAEALIAEVEKMVAAKIKDRDLAEKEKAVIGEQVAVGALKYSILKQAIGGNIIFDFEKSISFDGDSGPYLQYAHTRALSILERAKQEKVRASLAFAPKEVSEIERMICRFPEVVERAGKEYAPNYLVTYLTELARSFSAYYAKVKVVDSADEYSPYKLALTSAFGQVMENGLEILGISAPEEM